PSDSAKMRRLGERLDKFEAATMLKRGHAASRCGDLGWVDVRHDHAGLGAAFGNDAAPWIDDQRMTEGLAAVLTLASWPRAQHVAAVLDGARAVEHMPVRLAGLPRERRWNGKKARTGLGQRSV